VPNLIAALQEQLRIYTESTGTAGVARSTSRTTPRDSKARDVLRKLEQQHPGADTELDYRNPYELLVATILSAQSTDAGVNRVTPRCSSATPMPERSQRRTVRARTSDSLDRFLSIEGQVAGRHGACARRAIMAAKCRREWTTRGLPGVGRKTANVVLGHALGIPGLPVDRHVLRVANRIGIAHSDDAVEVEHELGAQIPQGKWIVLSDTLILHGRRICKPKPLCAECLVREQCDYYRKVVSKRSRR
jgi:endonuclease-3